jgi:hypothetical protein
VWPFSHALAVPAPRRLSDVTERSRHKPGSRARVASHSNLPGPEAEFRAEVLRKPIEHFIRLQRVTEWAQFGNATRAVQERTRAEDTDRRKIVNSVIVRLRGN